MTTQNASSSNCSYDIFGLHVPLTIAKNFIGMRLNKSCCCLVGTWEPNYFKEDFYNFNQTKITGPGPYINRPFNSYSTQNPIQVNR